MSGGEVQSFLTTLLGSALVASAPLTLASLGETVGERAGLLNLGLEGVMLSGALAGFVVALGSGSLWLGLLAGLAIGLAFGLLFALLTVHLRVDQVVVGLGLTIFGGGLTGFLFRDLYGRQFPTSCPGCRSSARPSSPSRCSSTPPGRWWCRSRCCSVGRASASRRGRWARTPSPRTPPG